MRKAIFLTLALVVLMLAGRTELSRAECNLRCSSHCFFLYLIAFNNPYCGYYPKCCVNYWMDCTGHYCQDESCCYIA